MYDWIERVAWRLDDEEGTAITEMAIMLPAILIVLLWGIFFTDILIVRLKVLEASRMALWETTVYRQPTEIKSEVQNRFADLDSTDKKTNVKKPIGFFGITDVKVKVNVANNLKTHYLGGNNKQDNGGIGGFLSGVGVNVDKGLDWILGKADLNTHGTAQSTVSISVKDTVLPTSKILDTVLATNKWRDTLTFSDQKQQLIYDSWKAWPHKGATVGSTDNNTDVYKTYPVAEQVTSDHVSHLAFLGLSGNQYIGDFNKFLSALHMPSPLSTSSFQATGGQGPVSMLPSAPIKESWVPGHGMKPYRLGDLTFNSYVKSGNGFDTPAPTIDRARPTLPYKIASDMWGVGSYTAGVLNGTGSAFGSFGFGADLAIGGYQHQELSSSQTLNDYYRTYQCRGHYYDGMVIPDGVPGGSGFLGAGGGPKDYNGCNGSGNLQGSMNGAKNGGLTFPAPTLPSLGSMLPSF